VEFGVLIASKIDEVGLARHAENLGFDSAWFADSQLIWSDCYATLALAAQQTTTIRIGTGVASVGTRIAPVTAAAIATINRLAPGRTFLGLGSGHTSSRMLGDRPATMADFEAYLRIVKSLIGGDEVDYPGRARAARIWLDRPDLGFIDIQHRIPVYLAAAGPRARAIAGRHADGIIDRLPTDPRQVATAREQVVAASVAAGSSRGPRIVGQTGVVVLEPGETLESPRVRAEAGPMALSRLHSVMSALKEGRQVAPGLNLQAGQVPPFMRSIWPEYEKLLATVPQEKLSMRIHAGHCLYVHPDEEQFVTPELIENSVLVGRPDELVERVSEYEHHGLTDLLLMPPLEDMYGNIERFARSVMAAY
jgi:5,10-methylenetetrahydromethanopterin reductase